MTFRPSARAWLVVALVAGCGTGARQHAAPADAAREEVLVVARSAATARRSVVPAAPALAVRTAGSHAAPVLLDPERTDVVVTVVGPLVSLARRKHYPQASGPGERVLVFTPPPTPGRQDFVARVGGRAMRILVRDADDAARMRVELARQGHPVTGVDCDAAGTAVVPLAHAADDVTVETIGIAAWHEGAYEVDVPRVPAGAASLTVDLHGGGPVVVVSSPSHQIDSAPASLDHLRVTPSNPATLRDADFVLRYRVDPKESPGTVLAEPDGADTLVGLFLHPQETNLEPVALANVAVDWGAPVAEVRPPAVASLAAGAPLVLLARIRGRFAGPVLVTGRAAGKARTFAVAVAASPPAQGLRALPVLWARAARAETVASR